ncbi:MAG: hypothetical protein A2W25_10440 [candidate division Zixibacteria bacterium RBG_16_53_22]|nr:MAG: hypothetical protein A2W25_10440 [candidate division Zixibacteria bacterium RBG_16_53_22]
MQLEIAMIRKPGSCFIAIIMLSATAAVAQDDTTRVLFIGNSHTYTNNVPMLFAGLSNAGSHPVVTGMSAPGGYTLQQHTTNATTLAMISQGNWDYVSLQEQSLYPVIDYYRFGSFYPAARFLDSVITNNRQQTALYMTWGRPGGGRWSIGGHYTIDFVDFFHMQDSVSASFRMLADELAAPLVPAGDAWARALRADSTITLWQADSLHATLEGSYLVACVFYAVLFQASPVGLTYYGGLSPEDALFLQVIADQTVTGVDGDLPSAPSSWGFYLNYPNPFNSSTTLIFDLPADGPVELVIYDILGAQVRKLADGEYASGRHKLTWDGRNKGGELAAGGIYFSVLRHGGREKSIKLLYLK